MNLSCLNPISFSDTDISELRKLLESRDHVQYLCNREMSGIWLHTEDYQAELRLLILSTFRVTVSRVCFNRQRAGTMTAVLAWLTEFCQKHQIPTLVIQCVETEAMIGWCNKNGFTPVPSASCIVDGLLMGDYEKEIPCN